MSKSIDYSKMEANLRSLVENEVLVTWSTGDKEVVQGIDFINNTRFSRNMKNITSILILNNPQAKALYAKKG